MPNTTPHAEHEHPPFSLPLFITTILGSLAALLAVLKFAVPAGYMGSNHANFGV